MRVSKNIIHITLKIHLLNAVFTHTPLSHFPHREGVNHSLLELQILYREQRYSAREKIFLPPNFSPKISSFPYGHSSGLAQRQTFEFYSEIFLKLCIDSKAGSRSQASRNMLSKHSARDFHIYRSCWVVLLLRHKQKVGSVMLRDLGGSKLFKREL